MKKSLLAVIVVAEIAGAFLIWNRPAQEQTEAATAPAAQPTGVVPFRMEQQWLIRLKLAQAQETQKPGQVYSTGRIVPAPSNRALVAPPLGGILDSRPLPQIGQRVSQGQLLATLIQTPTAAEAAQIHIE